MTTPSLSPPQSRNHSAINPLLSGSILPTLLRLSLPNTIGMVAMALVAIAETAYVGAFGTVALAALALVFPMVMLQQMMSGGAIGGGVSSAVSRAFGAGDEARASALAWHALVIGVTAGSIFTAMFLGFGKDIFRLLGGRDETLQAAIGFSNVVFLGAVPIWLTQTLSSILRGTGNMKVPALVLLGTSLGQIIIGGSLGFGLGPLPKLGMTGVALGQVLAFSAGAVFLLSYLVSGHARVRLSLRGTVLSWDHFRDILKVGALSCFSPLQTVLVVLILTRLVSEFGTAALAGYGIGARLEFLLVPITFGIGGACVPMVGTAIGAGRIARARRVAWTGGVLAAAILGGVGVIVTLWPTLWSALFTSEPGVIAATELYFRWVGPCYGLFGLGLCLYFASQGSGRMLGPVLAGTLRLFVVAAGGWWLTVNAAPAWSLFALIGIGMAAYGIATAIAVHVVSWGIDQEPVKGTLVTVTPRV